MIPKMAPQKNRNSVDSMTLWMHTYFLISKGEEKTRASGIKVRLSWIDLGAGFHDSAQDFYLRISEIMKHPHFRLTFVANITSVKAWFLQCQSCEICIKLVQIMTVQFAYVT